MPFVRPLLALVALLALAASSPQAAGPFDGASLAPSGAPPREGETFGYVLTIPAPLDSTVDVEVHVPQAALFVDAQGAEAPTLDPDSRVVRWKATTQAGRPIVVRLTFVAGLDAGGNSATTRVTLRPWEGEPTYLAHQALVDTVPAPAAVRLGGIGVTAAGLGVLAWFVSLVLCWLVLRLVRPRAAAWATVAIMVPAGFLAYFSALARDDLRIRALPATSCVVTDRVLDSRTGASRTSSSSGASTVYAPRLALRWMDGTTPPRASQGFGTDSRLSRGSASSAEAILARYRIGASVPCAIDARDPRRAYVERGFGGAYLFALIPLPLFLLGLWGLTRRHGRA